MKQPINTDLQARITSFKSKKADIFPELRYQPEIQIEETGDRRSLTQRIRDVFVVNQSIRS